MAPTKQKNMKYYIASRFDNKDEVRKIYARLAEHGHEIAFDWTEHPPIKPYNDHSDQSQEFAIADLNGARNCDVLIVISSDAGTGMYVELGAAMASFLERGAPRIFVIGEHNTRSMFYFHPGVNRRATIDDVIAEI